jgi:phenylpyruvate tautomerase PptA (4-oxalocrotonate tautomerase family)
VAEITVKDLYAAGSTHWQKDGTSVSVLVEDMSRNKYFFPGWNIICFEFYIHL